MTTSRRIVIVGGGYAGLAALQTLAAAPAAWQRVLIDPRAAHHNLPLLPDVIAHDFPAAALRYSHAQAARRWPCTTVADRIVAVDPDAGVVIGERGRHSYDVVIMACGGETALPSDPAWASRVCTLRSVDDALHLRRLLARQARQAVVVIGGGYTGVEAATAIRHHDARHRLPRRTIALVDHGPRPCHGLPPDLTGYITQQLQRCGIALHCPGRITGLDDRTLQLDDGSCYHDPLVVWTAGVRAPALLADVGSTPTRDGRCAVDACLRAQERIFIAGDAALVTMAHGSLRMSVQHALAMGRCAATNALRLLRNQAALPLRPWDPGYVVPMAHGRGAGAVFGWHHCGRLPSALHYLMATTFSYGLSNRLAVGRSSLQAFTRPWR